ncbi:MAG: hypothetical protein ACOH1J_09010 [Microbacteriaceae bacterium]
MSFSPSDRVAFSVIAGLAAIIGLLTAIGGVWHTVLLVAGDGPVELFAVGELPGAPFAAITSATVPSSELSQLSTSLLVAGSVISVLVTIAVFTAIVFFLVMTARSAPFHRFLFPVTLLAGFALTFGGLTSAALTGLGTMESAFHLGVAPDGPFEAAFTIEPGQWAFGLVVLVAAFVLRAGQRMQRDTEGLI